MKNKKFKIGMVCFALFLITFLVLQYVSRPFTEYKKEFAENYTVYDEVPIKGISVKDETIIKKSGNGQICYIINDGSKVAKDQLIGYQYPDDIQASAKYKSIKIDEYINTLENVKNKTIQGNGNYEILSKQINQNVSDINKYSSKGFCESSHTIKNNYIYNSTKREMTINTSTDLESSINYLKEQKKQIEKSLTTQGKEIYSPISGYFISKVDGYETSISQKNGDFSAADIDNFFEQKAEQNEYVGKFASSYKWQFVATVNSKYKNSIYVGKTANIKFSFISSSMVPVTVSQVKEDANDPSRLVITLDCDYMTDEISNIHCQNAKLVLDKYSGLQISKSSLRFNGDEAGVYVVYNQKMYFKKLDIIFENDSIIISKYNESDNSILKIYDEVIVEGPDLYDEKPI